MAKIVVHKKKSSKKGGSKKPRKTRVKTKKK